MENKYKIGIILNALFTLTGIVACIMCIPVNASGVWGVVAGLLLYALIIFYTVYGYKIPHGNLLKAIMLIFAISFLLNLDTAIKFDLKTNLVMIPLAMSAITYVAGRLDKIHQNKYLMCVILLMICHICFRPLVGHDYGFAIIHAFLIKVILWLDICSAYFLRYKLHKEAGLLDRVKE